jgi:hypothetical protein
LDEVIGAATSAINSSSPVGSLCVTDKNTLDFLAQTIAKIKEARNV